MHKRAQFGRAAEEAVIRYLQEQGYTCCARNYRSSAGEIDIVVRKDELLAFVEVKAREHCYFPLSEVIVPEKQRKIIRTARRYIFNERQRDLIFRFDVALVEPEGTQWSITYIPNAFTDEMSAL